MAVLYITEYRRLAYEGTGAAVLVGAEPSYTQTVAIGGASASSAALRAGTAFVRLHTDAICNVQFGPGPTATTSDMRLAANQTEFFGVVPGHLIAVIQGT